MKTIAQKCKEVGIAYTTYCYRRKKGWKNPLLPPQRTKVTPEILQQLEQNGIPKQLYHCRRSKGWSEFEAMTALPNNNIYYYMNGKTVHSQLSDNKYNYFYQLVNFQGLSVEEAFNRVTKK